MKYEYVFMRQMDEKDRRVPLCLLPDQALTTEGPGGADLERHLRVPPRALSDIPPLLPHLGLLRAGNMTLHRPNREEGSHPSVQLLQLEGLQALQRRHCIRAQLPPGSLKMEMNSVRWTDSCRFLPLLTATWGGAMGR